MFLPVRFIAVVFIVSVCLVCDSSMVATCPLIPAASFAFCLCLIHSDLMFCSCFCMVNHGRIQAEGWSTENWFKPPSNFIAGRS